MVYRAVLTLASIAGALSVLTSCTPAINEPHKPSILQFENTVRQTLRDPDSAKFRDSYVYPQPDGSFVACGSVNAKNGYGGYTGYRRFIATQEMALFDGGTALNIANFDLDWTSRCRDNTPPSYSNASGSPFRSYK